MSSQTNGGHRFDRGAWLHLLIIGGLLLFVLATLGYRFSQPTDGWYAAEPETLDAVGFIYQANVMGVESGLKPGDHLVAVEGVPLVTWTPLGSWSLRDEWQAGRTVRYTVVRDDREIELDVPLTHWNIGRYLYEARRDPVHLVGYLGVVLFVGVGLLAFWRSPNNPAARALWVLSGGIFTLFLALDVMPSMIADMVNPLATLATYAIVTLAFTVLLPPAFIRLALVFPRPLPVLERRPWVAYLPYVVGLVGVVAFVAQAYIFGWVWMAVSLAITLLLLVYQAAINRDAVSRAQLRWGLGGVVVGLGLFFLTYIPVFMDIPAAVETVLETLSTFGFIVMALALGVAVMRYRLFDIDVIIRRTTSYAILTGLLLLVYFGSVVVLQRLLSPLTGESTVAVVLSTLLIAALFLPLRRRVQDAIDRHFFRQKYDAEQVLEQFAATARDETDLDELTAELVRVIQETMQPEFVSVWLRPAGTAATPPISAREDTS